MIGFLSPDAVFYKCEPWGHTSKAFEIVESIYGRRYYGSAEKHLLSLGYLVLRANDAYMEYITEDGKIVLLTYEQMKWVENNVDNFTENVKRDLSQIIEAQEIRKRRIVTRNA
jgi:hypothetical protein